MFLAVPERRGPHAIVDEGKEGLLDEQLRVEDDEFGRGRDEVVALVEAEEFDKNLALVVLYNISTIYGGQQG